MDEECRQGVLPWQSSGQDFASSAGGTGSIPGAEIPHALGPKNQNIKQKQYCNKFNKDFKNGPHQKIKSFKKKKKDASRRSRIAKQMLFLLFSNVCSDRTQLFKSSLL